MDQARTTIFHPGSIIPATAHFESFGDSLVTRAGVGDG